MFRLILLPLGIRCAPLFGNVTNEISSGSTYHLIPDLFAQAAGFFAPFSGVAASQPTPSSARNNEEPVYTRLVAPAQTTPIITPSEYIEPDALANKIAEIVANADGNASGTYVVDLVARNSQNGLAYESEEEEETVSYSNAATDADTADDTDADGDDEIDTIEPAGVETPHFPSAYDPPTTDQQPLAQAQPLFPPSVQQIEPVTVPSSAVVQLQEISTTTTPAPSFSSFHIGFVGDASNLSRSDLEEQIEGRLEKAAGSGVPEYSGYLPEEYFDEEGEDYELGEEVVEYESNAPPYVPYQITDEDLLKRPPMVLSAYSTAPEEVIVYCYPFGEEEIMTKCLDALKYFDASGVYLPMVAEIGSEKTPAYYEEVRKLRNTRRADGSQYSIYGVAYDNPNWALITQVVLNHPFFSGVLLEWIGQTACVWNINQPSSGQLETIQKMAGPIYYFYRQQTCDLTLWNQLIGSAAFVNPNPIIDPLDPVITVGQFPKFLIPVFPCFQGEEGPCYQAFRNYPEAACSSRQKFAFSPYEPLGNLMMYFANDTCHGMPSHDLYSVV